MVEERQEKTRLESPCSKDGPSLLDSVGKALGIDIEREIQELLDYRLGMRQVTYLGYPYLIAEGGFFLFPIPRHEHDASLYEPLRIEREHLAALGPLYREFVPRLKVLSEKGELAAWELIRSGSKEERLQTRWSLAFTGLDTLIKLAASFRSDRSETDELITEGLIDLYRATTRFAPGSGRFRTSSYLAIWNCMIRHMAARPVIRLPLWFVELREQLQQQVECLWHASERPPRLEDLARSLPGNRTADALLHAIVAAQVGYAYDVSPSLGPDYLEWLYCGLWSEVGTTEYPLNSIPDNSTPNPEAEVEQRLTEFEFAQDLWHRLSPLERDVLLLWLKGCPYEAISKRLRVPVKSVDNALQRVRRKATRCLEAMRGKTAGV